MNWHMKLVYETCCGILLYSLQGLMFFFSAIEYLRYGSDISSLN